VIKQVCKVLEDIVALAGCTLERVGESMAWASIVENAE
jgi:hypothetical protein